jgi:hypothetical protein
LEPESVVKTGDESWISLQVEEKPVVETGVPKVVVGIHIPEPLYTCCYGARLARVIKCCLIGVCKIYRAVI